MLVLDPTNLHNNTLYVDLCKRFSLDFVVGLLLLHRGIDYYVAGLLR